MVQYLQEYAMCVADCEPARQIAADAMVAKLRFRKPSITFQFLKTESSTLTQPTAIIEESRSCQWHRRVTLQQ